MSFIAILALLPLALGGLTAGTTYTISPSSHTDYCLAPASATEGADLVLKKCDASSDIVFTLDGDQLKNTETNMCVDIRHGENESGTLAQMWGCYSDNPNQQFDVVGDEMKWIGRDKCLDLKDGEGLEGNGVQIWACYSHNTNQKWTFTEAEEVDGDDCETGSPTSPSTSAPSATASQDCDETEEYEVEIPGEDDSDSDDSEAPYCDEVESSTDDTTETETETETETTDESNTNSYTRRGRGQHWQRSLDDEFSLLDKRYIPKAPLVERRSRRHTAIHARVVTPTSTGL